MAALELIDVSKSYAEVHAVRNLSFSIAEGAVFGLLGPNGAGKTTTIRMVMQIIIPDSGQVRVFDQNNSMKQRDRIGYMPEERGLYKKMRVLDTILFFAEIKGRKAKETKAPAQQWLERFDLIDWRDKKVEDLSRGMQQKLQFICTIIHQPRLIILDEPFTGLDPINTTLLKDVMLELRQNGATIIFSTHLMEQVEKLCESICLINKGVKILSGHLKEIKAQFKSSRIRLRYDGKADFLKDTSLVANFDDYGQYVEIELAEKTTPDRLLEKAIRQVSVQHFEITEPSLNEIFIRSVKETKQEGGK